MNYETRIEECKQIALKALNEIEAIKKDMKEPESEYPKGKNYWFINSNEKVIEDYWGDSKYHKPRYNTGNYFLTEQEAQDELRWRIIDTKLVRFIKKMNHGWVPDWTDVSYKYCLLFNQKSVLCDTYTTYKHLPNKYYLKSTSFKDEIIDHIGEENLKWYLSR